MSTEKKRKTLFHVVQHLAPGGLETLVLDMVKVCSAEHEVYIVSLEGNKQEAVMRWPKLRKYARQCVFLDKKEDGTDWHALVHLVRLFKQFKPDVVHTHHIGPLLYAGLAARFAGVRCRIHTEHDGWHLSQQKNAWLQAAALNVINPILVADATEVKMSIQRHLHRENIVTIKNGIDCDYFVPGNMHTAREQLGLPLDRRIVGCAGRLEYVKGQEWLIRAMPHLPEDVHLVIAGNGSHRQSLESLVFTLKLTKRVTFLGLCNHMPQFYQSLDLFCLPSLNEGFPLSTLEAQACNIPVLATSVGGTHETLCPHLSRLCPPRDEHALALELRELLQLDKSLYPNSLRDYVVRHHNIRHVVEQYHQLTLGVLL
ncbi:glycosyltransferase [Vibrio sp. IRLE0018]|uniref:glycosyltransferase n=1 Tax=Vibrio floridensis TaxID=2908007 RepID=UPI001F2D15B7|nr:glycosyltransferase [Vibrio floridensis]MCF8780034.1 glycosyltransferase [Vibrio floridensis]